MGLRWRSIRWSLLKTEGLIGLDARVEIEVRGGLPTEGAVGTVGELTMTAAGRPPTPLNSKPQRIDATDHRGVGWAGS